ncbi:MAG: tetratricopeptide repeat protein [Phycisphaerales bacterium]|nr:tetratricopeptide repeat protein [Phycisphaerales bacterium]
MAINPDHAKALCNLGNVLTALGQMEEAFAALNKAVKINANLGQAQNNLGAMLGEIGRLDEAVIACRRAVSVPGVQGEFYNNLGQALLRLGLVDEAWQAFSKAIKLKPQDPSLHSNYLLAMHYQPTMTADDYFREVQIWNDRHARKLAPERDKQGQAGKASTVGRTPGELNRKLRIGYVSADFRRHAAAHFLVPILTHHNREQFEIHAFAQVVRPDEVTGQMRKLTDHWHELLGLDDTQAAELIRNQGIDILVDLSGHTAYHRLLVFAQKPAQVQVTYLGYPDSTGLATMDYRITDGLADPPGVTDGYYSEKLLRLPGCAWCYQPIEGDSDLSGRVDCTQRPVVFGCFNNFAKVNEPLLLLWARILQAVPESQMFFKGAAIGQPSVVKRLNDFFARQGIDANRLRLEGMTQGQQAHIRKYLEVDIALDTFPYHGTTTTCEALWMGTPVVSLIGDRHLNRVGLSLLTAVGLADLTAQNETQYIEKAVALAQDKTRLQTLHQTLRQTMKASPSMDGQGFTKRLENGYQEMWKAALPR